MFSIVIPSWNNLPYLRLCIASLRRNSNRKHQLLVHANPGTDGTREWLTQEGIEFTATDANVGICYAVNTAASRVSSDFVLLMNDDMVAAPGWDVALEAALQSYRHPAGFMLSATMIEPIETGNPCVVVSDFGRDPSAFDLTAFSSRTGALARGDWLGSTWQPALVTREAWQRVGGYSVEFSPGMVSDNDFSMKMWHAGCRVFVGVGASLFYHFAKVSTGRMRKNNGRRQFLMKWGMTPSTFDKYFLRRGEPLAAGAAHFSLHDPEPNWRWRLQRVKNSIKRRFA